MIVDPQTGVRIMTHAEYENCLDIEFQNGYRRGVFEANEKARDLKNLKESVELKNE